jgi:hypothetical protein
VIFAYPVFYAMLEHSRRFVWRKVFKNNKALFYISNS